MYVGRILKLLCFYHTILCSQRGGGSMDCKSRGEVSSGQLVKELVNR